MNQTGNNQQIVLAARPAGLIKPTDFTLIDTHLPSPQDNEVLIEVHYLAVEPAMRGWMEDKKSYIPPVQIGEVMRGQGSGVVLQSNNPMYAVGARVTGMFGWQRYCVSDGKSLALQKIPDTISQATALNVLGLTGLTAYFGMADIGQPQAGDTVLVSAAAGATGSIAGQLARIAGARVVGIAGGQAKCDWLISGLGFDGAINYQTEDTALRIAELCSAGINVYFDNVGGDILDMALDNLAQQARVVLCGGISRYNTTGPIPGPANYFNLVYRRARMEGFIVMDFAARFPSAIAQLTAYLDNGQLRHRETVLQGFEHLPLALMRLFSGGNIGKQLVAVTQ